MLGAKQKALLILFSLATVPVLVAALTTHGCGPNVPDPLQTTLGVFLYLSPWLGGLAAALWWSMQPREEGCLIAAGGVTAFFFCWAMLIANVGQTLATCLN